LIRITDEAEAFTILEQLHAAVFDYSIPHARFFRTPAQVVFFMFAPQGVTKGAHVFVFDNPPAAGDIETQLLNAVLGFSGDAHADELRELAAEVIREFLESKSAEHYFFDAH
jgi:hypothetical protein